MSSVVQAGNTIPRSCRITPTVITTPTPIILPTQTPIPSSTIEKEDATPSAIISSPIETQLNDSPRLNEGVSKPSCDITIPNKPEFLFVDSGKPGDGKLTLYWPLILNAVNVNIYYREYGKDFMYSVANWPNDGNKTIEFLKNTNYEFCLQGINRCAVGPLKCIDPLP